MTDTHGAANKPVPPLAPDRTLGIMAGKTYYIHDGHYYTTGGFNGYVEGMAAHFKHTVLVVPVVPVSADGIATLSRVEPSNYHIHPLPPFTGRTHLSWLGSAYIRHQARRAFADCDVLNFFLFSMCVLMAVPAMEAMSKHLSFVFMGETFYPRKNASGLRGMILRRMEAAMRRHLTFVRGQHLVDIHNLDPEKSVAQYSSSYHESDLRDQPNPTPKPDETIQLVFVGRIDGMKGVDVLLRALAGLGELRSRFHLNIVGDGHTRAQRETLAANLGVSENVTFHGYIPHGSERWEQMMASAHALSFLSLHEGTPKVVTEAMRFGMPVLASTVGAIPSIIKPNVNGWLVKPNQVEPTTQALRAMLDLDPDSWATMAKTNLEISRRYTIERDVIKVLETLKARGLLR